MLMADGRFVERNYTCCTARLFMYLMLPLQSTPVSVEKFVNSMQDECLESVPSIDGSLELPS
jgi:hypothetical protein